MLRNNLYTANVIAALLYLIGSAISYALKSPEYYLLPLWVPIGLSVGIILSYGLRILPGILIASLISHFFFNYHIYIVYSLSNFPFVSVLLIVMVEAGVLYLINWYREHKKWTDLIFFGENEVKNFFIQSLVLSIPLAAIHGWYLNQLQVLNTAIINIFTVLYLSTVASFLLFTPLYISWKEQIKNKSLSSNKELLIFSGFVVILVIIIFYQFLPSFTIYSKIPFFIAFPILIIISLKYSIKIYSTILTVFCLLLLYKPLIQSQSIDESMIYYADILGFTVIASFTTLFLKGQKYSIAKAKNELKSNYEFIENEIARQVNEYKQLNNQLLLEIEKRGIAERELQKNRSLLIEAQDVSMISTWEYSIAKKRFSWIYYNEKVSSFNIDFESSSIKSIAKKIHPDDLEKLKNIKDDVFKKNEDFEFEVRIMGSNNRYGYFLVRGRIFLENGKSSRVIGLLMDISEKKLAELELIEKEQKYQTLFDSNIDPVCVIDAITLGIQDVNSAFESVYGYIRDEIIGESYLTVSAQPDDTESAITYAMQIGYYRINNIAHRRKGGEEFFVEGTLMSYMVEDKKMLFVITHDITKRKENELRIAEREQKFRSFFESDLIGMAEVSIAKQWIVFNEKLTKILGYSPKELTLKTWDEITHPDDLLEENKLYKKILTHELDDYKLEKRFIAKNSSEVYCKVAVKAILSAEHTISHLIMMVDNISDRKRAEAELTESRAQLSQSQSVAKLGSIRLNKGSNQVKLSDEAYEILGFGKKRPLLSRKDFFRTLLPGPQTRFEQIICDLENGLPFEESYEQAFLSPSGDLRYILINFGISFNSNNDVTEVLITLADITQIKKTEIALQETIALKDQLFSIIGHDLRAPLGSIKQMSDILINNRKDMDEETIGSALNNVKKTSDETYELLINLLEWANSQQIDTYKPIITDLVPIVDHVISFSKGLAESKKIFLLKKLPENAPVIVDVEMIKTVLRNLISNSIKFTPQSGAVKVDLDEKDGVYEVAISDTGKGIPMDAIPKLFDNKSVYSTLGTNNEKGTGLGLKLVKKFVEKNNGTISVISEPGQGSVFTFTIPKFIEHE